MTTTFMSNDIRVEDAANQTIYTNPDQQEDIYDNDDVYVNSQDTKVKTEELYTTADQPTHDEMYVNPLPVQEQLYSDVGPSDAPELYVDPETMNKNDNQCEEDDELYANETKPEDELYVVPERMDDKMDETYVVPSSQNDDQTALLDHEGRGYERMKKGVSINDLNEEYVYATKDNHIRLDSGTSAVTDDGYQVMKSSEQIGESQQPVADDEYVDVTTHTIGDSGYRESQIYSSVQ